MVIELAPGVVIDEAEIRFQASRAGGPGGQNVNKVATRVTLFFDLEGASGLAAHTKERIRQRLATRISRDGVLRVTCQRHRSQSANRQAAMERLVELLQQALREDLERTPTRPRRAANEQRLEDKRRRADRKRARRVAWEDS